MLTASPVVDVAPVVVRNIKHIFQTIGTVQSPFSVPISPQITGRIIYLKVNEGDPVRRGEVLVRLDPSQWQAQVLQQRETLAEAEHRLAEAEITTIPTNVSVTTNITQQQATVASAKADYQSAQDNCRAQVAAAKAAVTDAKGKLSSAKAAIVSAQAAIENAKANLDYATSTYKRDDALYKQGALSAQDWENARTQMLVQQGALAVADGQLDSAQAAQSSAAAEVQSAQAQLEVVRTQGKDQIAVTLAKLNQAKAALAYAQSNRAQTPAYQQNLSALRATVAADRDSLLYAKTELSDTDLRSPLNGFVTGRMMDPGTVATPGQEILQVQAIRQVWVNVAVPEDLSNKLYLGQKASITLDALPGRKYTGKIVQINPAADPATRQFTVRIALPNPHYLIKPAMFARVSIVTDRVNAAIAVPREAIQTTAQGPSVWLVNADHSIQQIPVSIGASDASDIEIKKPTIQPGEQVVVLSKVHLRSGQKVKIANAAVHR